MESKQDASVAVDENAEKLAKVEVNDHTGNGLSEKPQQNGEAKVADAPPLPREIRFAEGEKITYPIEWLRAMKTLVAAVPEIEGEGRAASRSLWLKTGPRGGPGGGGGSGGVGRRVTPSPPPPRSSVSPFPVVAPSRMQPSPFMRGPPPQHDDKFKRFPGDVRRPIPGGSGHDRVIRGLRAPALDAQQQQQHQVRRAEPALSHLNRSENAWKREKDKESDIERKEKEYRSLLNKLTLEKFASLYEQIKDIEMSSKEVLVVLVKEIFEKAVTEPTFSQMYATLCHKLAHDLDLTPISEDAKEAKLLFRRELLNRCREEFQGSADKDKELDSMKSQLEQKVKEGKADMNEENTMLALMKAKRRMLGNVKFIGELYKMSLISRNIIRTHCIDRLTEQATQMKDEDVIECLCNLLTTIGAAFSQAAQEKEYLDGVFKRLETMSNDRTLPSRMRFMLKDLLDLRANDWKHKRQLAPQAKKIADLHRDRAEEEFKKQQQQQQQRGGGPGGLGGPDGHHGWNQYGGRRGGLMLPPRGRAQNMADMTSHMSTPAADPTRTNRMPYSARLSSRSGSNAASNRPTELNTVELQLKPGGGDGSRFGRLSPGGMQSFRPMSLGRPGGRPAGDASPSGNAPPMSFGRGLERVNRIEQTDTSASAAPELEEVQGPTPSKEEEVPEATISEELLKAKAANVLKEYLTNKSVEDAQLYLKEVPSSRHSDLVSNMIRTILFDLSPGDRPALEELFAQLCAGSDVRLSAEATLGGVKEILLELEDIEIDVPKATEWVGKLTAIFAANQSVDADNRLQLADLADAVQTELTPKFQVALGSALFGQYYQEIGAAEDKKPVLQEAYQASNMDLTASAKQWDESEGLEKLRTLLTGYEVDFILQE